MRVYFDNRWLGFHGIGRFAHEISQRCEFEALGLGGQPLSILDPWRLRQSLMHKDDLKHFFSPGFNPPLGKPCSFSLTVHDLIHLDVHSERSRVKTLYYDLVVKPGLKNAAVIFTDSEYSKSRITAWSGLQPEKVVNVGCAASDHFRPDGPKWQHQRGYVLYVGNQKPHKNIELLIRAFAASGLHKDLDLLITGRLKDHIGRQIVECGLENVVLPTGFVVEYDLPALYRGARALVMPSLYEGFGLPVVEAMACGTPVLSSNRTSLPEVGGSAALYFEPGSLESMVEGLRQIMDNSTMENMRQMGPGQAKHFSWDVVAAKVMAEIRKF